ncbi:MAG: thioredoxin [Vicinamibacterales bacterium]
MSAIKTDDRGILVVCAACGQKNRLAFDHLDAVQKCGTCKQLLPALAAPMDIDSSADFDRLVAHASLPVVVDFWAPWCGPCRMVAPELVKVAARQAGRLIVVKVNTDALPELGSRFAVRSIPTMSVFAEGKEVSRTAGARPAADIEAFVAQACPG